MEFYNLRIYKIPEKSRIEDFQNFKIPIVRILSLKNLKTQELKKITIKKSGIQ